jgi:hypothetical protein
MFLGLSIPYCIAVPNAGEALARLASSGVLNDQDTKAAPAQRNIGNALE